MDQNTSHPSVKTYLIVFACLGVLTGATVLLSYAGFSHNTGVAIAIVIAAMKCALIAAFFMHLKSENKGITYTMLVALFFVLVLIAAVIPDIGMVHK